MDENAGSTVQTKIPNRPGAALKTGGPIGGGMSSMATDGGIGATKLDNYLRSAPGSAKPLKPTEPAGGSPSPSLVVGTDETDSAAQED